jgi:flagellar L-ring protein precursor FlgH
MRHHVGLLLCLGLMACDRIGQVGRAPGFTPATTSDEYSAMLAPDFPREVEPTTPAGQSSLWAASRSSLLGDRRAERKGDIMTVVIQINDSAQMSNTSQRSRSGSESMGIPSLFGIPQRIDQNLPVGANMANAVSINSAGSSQGNGSVSRTEKVTLRVAATVIGVLPNGVLQIAGSQEVRVNFELRELLVSGFVRPEDISRQNEVTYDKIASARISYGGRGQITDVQQPRYGQQVADIMLPF